MLDLLLKGARIAGETDTREIGVRDGLIAEPEVEARQVIDLGGSLVTPALVEPHIHLDAVLTVGEPRQNQSGSLFEGIAIWAERVKELAVDVVGAIPHFELTREYGERSVKFAMSLAADKGLRVDIHCDETDDDHSRFVEVMAAETIRLGMGGRVTASHTTAMHSYNAAYAYRLINNLKRAQMHMVTNPLDNSVLQGRFDGYPIRRGHTRVKELLAAGVNVCVGHDSVMDPWYPLGYGDPLQAAFVLAHYGQMSGHNELRTLIDMITFNPASALGLEDYGLLPGSRADLCAFAAPTEMDAIRLVAPRKLVLRAGKVVARTEPSHTTVVWDGREEAVDFLRPGRT